MINPLRAQTVLLITKHAQAGLKKLDRNSALVSKLKGMDVDALLKDNIDKFCHEMSYFEMAKITTIAAGLNSGLRDKEQAKEEMKSIAKDIIKRVEQKTGNLNIPSDIRDLIFNL